MVSKKFYFGRNSQLNMIDLAPQTIELIHKALVVSDYDFSIIDGFRTVEDQQKVFNDNKSELDGIIKKSAHQSGLAIDILPYVRDRSGAMMNMYNYEDPKVKLVWYEVHRAFLRAARLLGYNIELGLTYIIDGKFDYPHVQIND